jgi:arylsulfatase A-like enzyme
MLKVSSILFKRILLLGGVIFGGTGIGRICAAEDAVAGRRKPNVLFIVADDQSLNSFGFIGKKALTPHIDSIAQNGVYFSRAYATSSVCTPSRFACLTGRFASRCASENFQRNGMTEEGQTYVTWNTDLQDEKWTLPKVMQQAGYVTGISGKWHNGYPPGWREVFNVPRDSDPSDPVIAERLGKAQELAHAWLKTLGFDYAASISLVNLAEHSCRKLRLHNQEWITKGALDFIDQNQDRPFFLYMATTLMHNPNPMASLTGNPLATHGGLLDEPLNVQPSRQSVLERTQKAGVPEWIAAATWLDDGIGAVLQRLDELNLTEDTLIVYFNDHGVEGAKGSCYEGGARTPAMVSWKGHIQPGTTEALIQNTDFTPTIFDACGIVPPEEMVMDGTSLMPLLQRKKDAVRDAVLLEMGYTRAIVTDHWKYLAFRIPPSKQLSPEERKVLSDRFAKSKMEREDVHFDSTPDAPLSHMGFPGGQGTERGQAVKKHRSTYFDADQLYDLSRDPEEKKNLASSPEHKAVLEKMQTLLVEQLHGMPGTFAEFKSKAGYGDGE